MKLVKMNLWLTEYFYYQGNTHPLISVCYSVISDVFSFKRTVPLYLTAIVIFENKYIVLNPTFIDIDNPKVLKCQNPIGYCYRKIIHLLPNKLNFGTILIHCETVFCKCIQVQLIWSTKWPNYIIGKGQNKNFARNKWISYYIPHSLDYIRTESGDGIIWIKFQTTYIVKQKNNRDLS